MDKIFKKLLTYLQVKYSKSSKKCLFLNYREFITFNELIIKNDL
jgi:hypothetical protein